MDLDLSLADLSKIGMKEAYNLYLTLANGTQEKHDYKKIRYGCNIKFDIHDFFSNLIELNFKTGFMEKFKASLCSFEDFNTEIEERDALIRKNLLILTSQDKVYKSRMI